MVQVQRAPNADDVRFGAGHILFVEGDTAVSFDPAVLSEFLPSQLLVEPLGPSFHVQSAAQALHKHHPYYYFLIDRDHHSDDEVEQSWKNFPDPNTSNLLIWRRREIENYFLIPNYLLQSNWLKANCTEEKLRNTIQKECQARLFLDIANQVIVSIREDFKEKWIEIFTDVAKFKSKENALVQLDQITEFDTFKKRVSGKTSQKSLKKAFHDLLNEFTGGDETVQFEKGTWLKRIRGKKVLNAVVNQCCKVMDSDDNEITGKEKVKEVVKDLLRQDINRQPDDFQKLYQLINGRIRS